MFGTHLIFSHNQFNLKRSDDGPTRKEWMCTQINLWRISIFHQLDHRVSFRTFRNKPQSSENREIDREMRLFRMTNSCLKRVIYFDFLWLWPVTLFINKTLLSWLLSVNFYGFAFLSSSFIRFFFSLSVALCCFFVFAHGEFGIQKWLEIEVDGGVLPKDEQIKQ